MMNVQLCYFQAVELCVRSLVCLFVCLFHIKWNKRVCKFSDRKQVFNVSDKRSNFIEIPLGCL